MKDKLAFLIATWFGSGMAKKAPGTFGTIAAVPFAWAIHSLAGQWALMAAAALLLPVGIWASNTYMHSRNTKHDPREIVVDEVAGVWLLLSVLPLSLNGYIAGFILFRFFDIIKPWPVSWVDRNTPGGLGVMLDDIAAALYPMVLLGLAYLPCWWAERCGVLSTLYQLLGG